MTASELAFLALGLLLGAASGAALITVLGNSSQRREIRVTVTRGALPGRSATLSQDAFVTSPGAPARGGPGDRRWFDRDLPPADLDTWKPALGAPVAVGPGQPVATPVRPAVPAEGRTIVPFVAGTVGIDMSPEPDPILDDPRLRPNPATAFERILRGEHRAMVEVIDSVAGEDSRRRRDWEVLLGGLVEAMAEVAVGESVIDFPMGTAFWDAFTVEQCRRIVASLATMGFRYDGRAGWVEHHVPVYRDLTQALADIGEEPRRLRAWPNQAEIAALFVGARPAPEELLAAAGPDYDIEGVQALVGSRASELSDLWVAWEAVRPHLFAQEPVEVLAAV